MLTIVSGAAPGVEQGAIESAVNLALHWKGWASREHIAALPAIYRTGLQPTSASEPGMVRRLNCQDADGALVFSTSMVLAGVPAFVDRVTEQMGRAFLHVTLNPAALQSPLPDGIVAHIRDWIRSNELARVYVTGPSADDVPGIQGAVRDALIAVLEPFAVDEIRETTRALNLIEQATNPTVVNKTGPLARPPGTLICAAGALLADLDLVPDPVDSDAPARTFASVDRTVNPTSLQHVAEQLAITPELFRECSARLVAASDRANHGPPEGLDDLQRAQLDASIREAERDIRDPVEERVRAYHDLVATAPGPIGGGYHDDDDDEPPAPGDQTA